MKQTLTDEECNFQSSGYPCTLYTRFKSNIALRTASIDKSIITIILGINLGFD